MGFGKNVQPTGVDCSSLSYVFFLGDLSSPHNLSTIVEHSELLLTTIGSNVVGCGEEIVFCDGI